MCTDMVPILLLSLHTLALTFHFVLTRQCHIHGSVRVTRDCSEEAKARPGSEGRITSFRGTGCQRKSSCAELLLSAWTIVASLRIWFVCLWREESQVKISCEILPFFLKNKQKSFLLDQLKNLAWKIHQITHLKRGFLILPFHAHLRLQINYANLVFQ